MVVYPKRKKIFRYYLLFCFFRHCYYSFRLSRYIKLSRKT